MSLPLSAPSVRSLPATDGSTPGVTRKQYEAGAECESGSLERLFARSQGVRDGGTGARTAYRESVRGARRAADGKPGEQGRIANGYAAGADTGEVRHGAVAQPVRARDS